MRGQFQYLSEKQMTSGAEEGKLKREMIIFLGLTFWPSLPGWADPIPIGVLSFDVFTPPANGSPGVNAFNISNFTGTFDLPPDLPASTALTFMNAVLEVDPNGGAPQDIPLGDVAPGPLQDSGGNPLPVLQFPSTEDFTSATFTAMLSPTTFMLSDGSTFVGGATIALTLSPSSGPVLMAGTDDAVIAAQPAAGAPEPGSFILFGTALAAVLWRTWRNHNL